MEINVEETKVMRISRQPSTVEIMIDKKQLETVKYLKYLGSLTSDARSALEIRSRIVMAKKAFNKKKKKTFYREFDFNLRKKLTKSYTWNIALYGAETWTLRKVDQEHVERFEMWCWRRMEKINWTDRVRNEEVLHRVKEVKNIVQTIKGRKVNWIGMHCLLEHVIEGKTEGTRIRGRRHKQLLDDLRDKRGYWILKEEPLSLTLWITCFGKVYGPLARQTA
jgi:hypothetical protein